MSESTKVTQLRRRGAWPKGKLLDSGSSHSGESERDSRFDHSILGLKKQSSPRYPHVYIWQRKPFTGCFHPPFQPPGSSYQPLPNCWDNGPLHPPPSFLVFAVSGLRPQALASEVPQLCQLMMEAGVSTPPSGVRSSAARLGALVAMTCSPANPPNKGLSLRMTLCGQALLIHRTGSAFTFSALL